MALPLVILDGRGDGKKRNERVEHPDNYTVDGCYGHLYKGIELFIDGQPLIEHIINAYGKFRVGNNRKLFSPIYIVGPCERHRGLAARLYPNIIRLIDTDGPLHKNLRRVGIVLKKLHPDKMAVFQPSDEVPAPEGLEAYVDQVLKADADGIDGLMPIVDSESLRAIGVKKPEYGIRDEQGELFKYSWGQVYALRPSRMRWGVLQAGARIGYRERAGAFRQNLWKGRNIARFVLSLGRPMNWPMIPFLLKNAKEYTDKIRSGDITIGEAEYGAEQVLMRHPLGKDDPKMRVWFSNHGTLAADIDGQPDLIARAQAMGAESCRDDQQVYTLTSGASLDGDSPGAGAP